MLLCMMLCIGLMPAMAFAADDPVITNVTATRDSETTATITFDSSQDGSVAIAFKNSDGTFELYIGDKDGVTAGKNVIKYEFLEGSDAKEIAVYFGTNESDFDALYSSQNPLDMPGAVKGTVPPVHTCAASGEWKYDGDNHWKLCGICGNRVDEAAHSGGTATCTEQAICETCQQPYGSVDPDNHTGKIVWTQTETGHSSAYDCCGAEVIAEENHEWTDGVCSECSYECRHTGGTATCTEQATCTNCGSAYGALGQHALTEHTYKAPTCTETGNEQYWECSVCDRLFSDEQGSDTTTVEEVTIAQTGHDWSAPVWNWSEDGKTASAAFTCENDGAHTQSVDADITGEEKDSASCTEAGTTAYTARVTFGGTEYSSQKDVKDISPLGHSMQKTDRADATCTAPGKEAYYTCEVCGKHFEDEEGSREIANLDEYGIIPTTDHEAGAEWKSDETGHWKECLNCGDKMNEVAHTYEWVTDKEPTATEEGSRHEECTVCGYVGETETIAATGTTETPSDPGQTEETPSAADDTEGSATDNKTGPETGDSSNPALWITLLLLSLGGLTGVIIYSGKRKAA
ncbi:MAG TPA: hypothetical protein IAC50_07350 [Candidatus Copromorpha excrementigallinarum]|uniref:Gram-positive cocci surface proteins LPxTG domain-containing protein n=1 Tax=Candidatus Allocopromorpha excrementigallinarum TaxID=2840742 RepID=A0A9D1L630_9FIRM|nr:hypothetical protein [Candidatus Copromorpha excrementigallinarum]